jgi:ribosomal protein S27AE
VSEYVTDDRCRRGHHCAARDSAGEPAPTPRPQCDLDADELLRILDELPEQLVRLRLALVPSGGLSERVSGTRSPSVPLRLDVEALMRDLVGITAYWAAEVAAVVGLTTPPRRIDGVQRARDGWALTAACAMLRNRVSVLLALPPRWINGEPGPVELDGGDGALELFTIHLRARRALGLTRLVHRFREPCPQCSAKTLTRPDGAETVMCASCGQALTMAEHEALANAYARPSVRRSA